MMAASAMLRLSEVVMDLDAALKELARIDRQRVVVQQSLCSDAVKARLLAQLKAKAQALELTLEGPTEAPAGVPAGASKPSK